MTLSEPILIAAIKIVPSVLWFILVCLLLRVFYPFIRDDLLPKMTGFEAGGVKISFMRSALDAAVELAEKSPQWQVSISQEKKESAVKRAQKNISLFKAARFLWIDDTPENSRNERRMFIKLGADIDVKETGTNALKSLAQNDYDLIISDMERDGNQTAGLEFLSRLQDRSETPPLIFYIGILDPDKGVPAGAFGVTNRPDELLHLTVDVLERRPV